MYMKSCTNISYFGVYTSELVMEKGKISCSSNIFTPTKVVSSI